MGERITIEHSHGATDGYLALPAGPGGPAVVVIQEWWGLVGHIAAVADRFAAAGYVAFAPDLYHGVAADEPGEAAKLMMGMAMPVAGADIAASADYLSGRADVTGGVGTVGFCMGGSLALWAATLTDAVVASVGFYPAVPWERMSPVWSRYDGKAALIHTSEEDGGPQAPGIVAAVDAIRGAGGSVDVCHYPNTHHAFFNDERPEVFDAAASELAWQRTLEHFRRNLSV